MLRVAAVLVLGLSISASARAQFSVVYDRDVGCVPIDGTCIDDSACEMLRPGLGATCDTIPLEGGGSVDQCRPHPSVHCCGSAGPVCPAGTICHLGMTGESGLCLDAENNYCDPALDLEKIELCHTSTEGFFPVEYADGDCDDDGVSNLAEQDSVTDPCLAPPDVIGVWVDAGADIACVGPIHTCPSTGDACSEPELALDGTCQRDERTGEAAPLCAPSPALFCCGGALGAVCPALTCVMTSDRDVAGVCTDPAMLCGTTEASLRACHTSPSGVTAVPVEQGDCDGDDIDNGTERARGSDPCVADVVTEGPPPSFAGGGGFRCGIAPAERSAVFLPFVIALLFALYRRRA